MIIGFLLPYGLISAELGTTYDGEGGLYDWISKAYGRRMGSRTAWYYWVNFPLWMASLAVMFPEIIGICTGANISTWLSLLIQLAFVWIVAVSYTHLDVYKRQSGYCRTEPWERASVL